MKQNYDNTYHKATDADGKFINAVVENKRPTPSKANLGEKHRDLEKIDETIYSPDHESVIKNLKDKLQYERAVNKELKESLLCKVVDRNFWMDKSNIADKKIEALKEEIARLKEQNSSK